MDEHNLESPQKERLGFFPKDGYDLLCKYMFILLFS